MLINYSNKVKDRLSMFEEKMGERNEYEKQKKYWEGKEVWVVLNAKEGIWRQGQVVCMIPAEQDHPTGNCIFVVDTRHDSWRHIVELTPLDGTGLKFDHLKISDAAVLPAKEDVFKGWKAPAWFDIVPLDSPTYQIKDGSVSLHPYVSEEITELRRQHRVMEALVEELRDQLDVKTAECSQKTISIEELKNELVDEKQRFGLMEDQLMAQIIAKEKECELLTATNADLTKKVDELRHLLNQVQAENNTLSARLDIMLDELVKVKTLLIPLEHELDEKNRQTAMLTHDNTELSELLQLAQDRIAEIEEHLRVLERKHYELEEAHKNCGVVRKSIEDENDRLRRRPPIAPPPPVVEHDDSALHLLIAQYESQYENIWLLIYDNLTGLSDRVAALEGRNDWDRGSVAPIVKEPIVGDEGPAIARKLASCLGGEVSTLQGRIERIEEWLNQPPATPPPVVIPNLDRSPDLDHKLLAQIHSLVKYLNTRVDDVNAKLEAKQPKYTATYKQMVPSLANGSQYDGDFPWLVTKKLHALEIENKLLKDQHDLTKARHYELVNRTDVIVAPVLKENSELRQKIDKYRDDLMLVYRRLSNAEEVIKKTASTGLIDGALLNWAGLQTGFGV